AARRGGRGRGGSPAARLLLLCHESSLYVLCRLGLRPLLPLGGSGLLPGDGAPRSLARPGVGVRALAAHRQVPAMAQAAVATEIDQALDVRGRVAAEIALDLVRGVDLAPDARHLLLLHVLPLPPPL